MTNAVLYSDTVTVKSTVLANVTIAGTDQNARTKTCAATINAVLTVLVTQPTALAAVRDAIPATTARS